MFRVGRIAACALAGMSLWTGTVYGKAEHSPDAAPKNGVPIPLETVDIKTLTKGTDAENNPLWLLDKTTLQNGEAVVRFKILAAEGDQDIGVVFRYLDTKNFYVVVASAKDDECALYRVREGRWKKIGSQEAIVTPLTWHEIRILFVQDRYTGMLDGQLVLGIKDSGLKGAGKLGLWGRVGSHVAFENFRVTSLNAAPQP